MALLSMTGYGEAQGRVGEVDIAVEIRSINHRFLDVNCKLPQPYSRFEQEFGKIIRAALKRGRVDVFVSRSETGRSASQPEFHEDVFSAYLEVTKRALKIAGLSEKTGLAAALPNLLFRREVLEVQTPDANTEVEWKTVEGLARSALARLLEMRGVEGRTLENELKAQLTILDKAADAVRELAAKTPQQFQERLKLRLDRLSPEIEIEPSRLAQEVAILADRVDVTEEIVRLKSHLEQFRKVMQDGEGGRKLEFLLQEIGREINTIGSKAQNVEITNLVVDSKAVVEKIREQVLNLE